MTNGKIWLVVNPTVGIPIFLLAVAIGSLIVHIGILTHTEWYSKFLSGEPMAALQSLTSLV